MTKSSSFLVTSFLSRCIAVGSIAVGLSIVFLTIVNLDAYFVGKLDAVLPATVIVRFAVGAILVAVGSLAYRWPRRLEPSEFA